MTTPACRYIEQWLSARLSTEDTQWLQSRVQLLQRSRDVRDLHIALGLVPRKLGRADLALSTQEISALRQSSNLSLDPSEWTIETAARLLLLSTVAAVDEQGFGALFKDLCQTADLSESITLYRGISLFPHSESLYVQVGEGLRTSIRAVFEAIAHRNPYPYTFLDENRWNHMVLKALFIESTLWPIQGLDARANPELARILCDYAHERWAAHRNVTIELWRCVGPFASGSMLDDLIKVSTSDVSIERQAALLALASCPEPAARVALDQFPDEALKITRGEITWDSLSKEVTSQLHSGDQS